MPPYNLIHAQFPMNATQEFKKNDQITPKVYGTITLYG